MNILTKAPGFSQRNFSKVSLLLVALALCSAGIFLFYTCRAYYYYIEKRHYFSSVSLFQEDSVLGFTQKPNIAMRFSSKPNFMVYTNGFGLRVRAPGLQIPTQVDVLAIGCSYTWGHAVEDSTTYLELLGHDKKLRVANAAVPSYGTTTAYLSLKKYAFLKPKIVVYGFISDHIRRTLKPCAPSMTPYCRSVPYVDFDSSRSPSIRPPGFCPAEYRDYKKDVFTDHAFGLRDIYWAVRRDFLHFKKLDGDSVNAKFQAEKEPLLRFKALEYLMDLMVRQTRSMNASLVVLFIPTVFAIEKPPVELVQVMEKYRSDKDIYYVDTYDAIASFAARHGNKVLMAGGIDAHPSEIGHKLIAETLSPVLDTILNRPKTLTGVGSFSLKKNKIIS